MFSTFVSNVIEVNFLQKKLPKIPYEWLISGRMCWYISGLLDERKPYKYGYEIKEPIQPVKKIGIYIYSHLTY